MKISRDEKFAPITIVIESEMELDTLVHCLEHAPLTVNEAPRQTLTIDEDAFRTHLKNILQRYQP